MPTKTGKLDFVLCNAQFIASKASNSTSKDLKYTSEFSLLFQQIHVTTLTNPFSDLDNRWSDHQVDKDDWDDQDNHRGVDDLDNCQDHRDCEALEYLEDGEKDDGDLGKGDV